MEKSNLKNIVVLKNLPSNIVDEAIVILKPTKKTKKIEILEKNNNTKQTKNSFETNKHVLKEAEMLVATYISKIEKREKKQNSNNKLNKKYEILKKYAIISSIILAISIIFNFI